MPSDRTTEAPGAASPDPRGLYSRGFSALLATQFLGVFNDNFFRWLIVRLGIERVGQDHAALVLAVGGICLVLPFILLAAPAGVLADRVSRKTVIVWCKFAEVVVMGMGSLAIWQGSALADSLGAPRLDVYVLFVVLFLMGSQSAMFAPSRLSTIPDLLRPEEVPAGNGVHGLVTIVAVIGGTMAGTSLYDVRALDADWFYALSAGGLLGVAGLGCLTALALPGLPAANRAARLSWNLPQQTAREVLYLAQQPVLFRVALGSAFFWGLASLSQLNVERFHAETFNPDLVGVGPLLACLSLGVALGNLLAGYCSAGRIEFGILPLSGLGIVASCLALAGLPVAGGSGGAVYWLALAGLGLLGGAGGMFDVPLQACLQRRSDPLHRGSLLAAANFLCYASMILAMGSFWALYDVRKVPARGIFVIAGLATLAVTIYAFFAVPRETIRFVLWAATRLFYRVRVRGLENVPSERGALLISNHISWVDGVLVLVTAPRHVRFMVWGPFTELWWARWLCRTTGVIPVKPTPKAARHALDEARRAVLQGDVVCIFPEGGITRTGQMLPFRPGFLQVVEGTDVPIVPVYLQGLWGSIFSFAGGKFFWKLPTRLRYPVAVHYGPPVPTPPTVARVRRAIQDLELAAMSQPLSTRTPLPLAMVRNCRRALWRPKIADSAGAELTGGSLLMRSLIFRRLLRREVLSAEERFVGLLLPPSAGGVLANAALAIDRRVAVNLNYTLSSALLAKCIERAGIRHVLTSRKFMERVKLEVRAELVYLEDLVAKVGPGDKAAGFVGAYLTPLALLERQLGLRSIRPDDLLTVIFTSGSTGDPKGVMLSQDNVASNIAAIDQIIRLRNDDVALGVLPFFHSYGYTATMWTALALAPKGVYHFNPLDAQHVGKLCREHRATVFMATPTFLRTYLRRCQREDFTALEVVFASAERLPKELSDAFEEKFGVRPFEAYGATELSPLVAANIPASRAPSSAYPTAREGSVGQPIPGVITKVVNPDTGLELPPGEPGMLLVGGPGVMQGYLNQPELTAEKVRDGWYVTGDLARIDEEGFLSITGRQSRFSKLGGEMVPHTNIEEAINRTLGAGEDHLLAVVTAVPDAKKGERLVVLHTAVDKSPDEICQELAALGLPNLWIPSPDSFCQVEQIPVLGTGKLDLKALKDLALERFAAPHRPAAAGAAR
jgi:acyl-[acyl-carrier-protein]-phospholipid O-acyltransferase/long-chain-fatty-acid--[acyl-carrier-protein] ligase